MNEIEKLAALRLEAKSAPSSEQRKQVTVLFTELSGFTALSERMDAEDVRDNWNSRMKLRHGGPYVWHRSPNLT